MAGRAVNLFSNKLKDSLPPSEDLWNSVSQKMNDTLHQASSLVGYTGEKLKESRTLVKRFEERVSGALPYVKRFVGFTEERMIGEEALPSVKNFVGSTEERVSEEVLPSVKSFVMIVLFGLVVLIVLWKWKGWYFPKMTMKAPGRNYRMPRADFERNPRSYFHGLRGKKD